MSALFGTLVGLALGLTGGGGSIFAIPLLVYGLQLPMGLAVPVSLLAVALTALIGAFMTFGQGLIAWRPAAVFAVGGVLFTPVGLSLGAHLQESVRLIAFATLMLVVAAKLWRKAVTSPASAAVVRADVGSTLEGPVCRFSPSGQLRFTTPCALVLVVAGAATGLLAGLFGVGGGFLIVPALIFVTQLGMQRAVATSLVIIAAIGTGGSVVAISAPSFDLLAVLPLLIWFVIGSFVGMAAGRLVAKRLAGAWLQKLFALMVFVTALVMFLQVGTRYDF